MSEGDFCVNCWPVYSNANGIERIDSGGDQRTKTLNEKRSYNMVPAAPEGVVLIFSAPPSTTYYERMGAKL